MQTNETLMVPDVDWLSNVIRRVDGNNSLGAGALAEEIVKAMTGYNSIMGIRDAVCAFCEDSGFCSAFQNPE